MHYEYDELIKYKVNCMQIYWIVQIQRTLLIDFESINSSWLNASGVGRYEQKSESTNLLNGSECIFEFSDFENIDNAFFGVRICENLKFANSIHINKLLNGTEHRILALWVKDFVSNLHPNYNFKKNHFETQFLVQCGGLTDSK